MTTQLVLVKSHKIIFHVTILSRDASYVVV